MKSLLKRKAIVAEATQFLNIYKREMSLAMPKRIKETTWNTPRGRKWELAWDHKESIAKAIEKTEFFGKISPRKMEIFSIILMEVFTMERYIDSRPEADLSDT